MPGVHGGYPVWTRVELAACKEAKVKQNNE
jgi:hypothetical protein